MDVIVILIITLMFAASPPIHLRARLEQKQDSSVPLKDLRNTPTMITIDNRSFHLSTYPWRDFMPSILSGDGSPLMVAVKITSDDKQPLPSGLRIHRVWVLYGEQSWEVSDLRSGKPGQDLDKDSWMPCAVTPVCEATVRGGPRWGPGVYVDVVVRFTDSDGKEHFLQAPNQYVLRAD